MNTTPTEVNIPLRLFMDKVLREARSDSALLVMDNARSHCFDPSLLMLMTTATTRRGRSCSPTRKSTRLAQHMNAHARMHNSDSALWYDPNDGRDDDDLDISRLNYLDPGSGFGHSSFSRWEEFTSARNESRWDSSSAMKKPIARGLPSPKLRDPRVCPPPRPPRRSGSGCSPLLSGSNPEDDDTTVSTSESSASVPSLQLPQQTKREEGPASPTTTIEPSISTFFKKTPEVDDLLVAHSAVVATKRTVRKSPSPVVRKKSPPPPTGSGRLHPNGRRPRAPLEELLGQALEECARLDDGSNAAAVTTVAPTAVAVQSYGRASTQLLLEM